VAKVVLVSAVTPSVLQTDANPAGTPQAAFEGLQAGLAANRSEFYRAVASGPFYNFDQPGVEASEAVVANWWRQGMTVLTRCRSGAGGRAVVAGSQRGQICARARPEPRPAA